MKMGHFFIDNVPKLYFDDDGEVVAAAHLAGEVGLSDGAWGDLVYYDKPDHAVTLKEFFISEFDF